MQIQILVVEKMYKTPRSWPTTYLQQIHLILALVLTNNNLYKRAFKFL